MYIVCVDTYNMIIVYMYFIYNIMIYIIRVARRGRRLSEVAGAFARYQPAATYAHVCSRMLTLQAAWRATRQARWRRRKPATLTAPQLQPSCT